MPDTLTVRTLGPASAPDLVLLHGWGVDSVVWHRLTESLAARYRLWLLDWPGYGANVALQAPAELDALAARVLPALPPRASWLGWSLGGQLATALAQRAPQRVERLLLLASNPVFVARPDWPAAMPVAEFERFAGAFVERPQATLTRFLALQLQGEPNSRALLRQLQGALRAQPTPQPSALQVGLDWLATLDGRAALADLALPVWHLLGERDPLVPVALAQALRTRYPHQPVRILPDCGHAPMLSCPQALAQVIAEALAQEAP